jgi:NAD kinase
MLATFFATHTELLIDNIEKADYIVVWWWDGWMLDCMRKYMHCGIPFLGLNCGTRGFLLNTFDEKELCTTCEDRIDCIDAWCIEADVYHIDWQKTTSYFLNDITIWGSVLDYFTFTIDSQQAIQEIKWTALVVCTALWSTGYALNLWQPLIPLQSRMWWISWLATAPFHYRFLQPQEIVIELVWRSIWIVWLDGYNETHEQVKKIILRSSEKKVQLAFFKSQPFAEKRLLLTEEKLGR